MPGVWPAPGFDEFVVGVVWLQATLVTITSAHSAIPIDLIQRSPVFVLEIEWSIAKPLAVRQKRTLNNFLTAEISARKQGLDGLLE